MKHIIAALILLAAATLFSSAQSTVGGVEIRVHGDRYQNIRTLQFEDSPEINIIPVLEGDKLTIRFYYLPPAK